MSRIGERKLNIPEGVTVNVEGAIVTVKGNKGVYMLKVLNSTNFGDKFDAKQEQETTSSQNVRMATSAVMQTLYLNANVKDQRYKFF